MLEIIFTGIGSAIFSVVVYLYKNWRKTVNEDKQAYQNYLWWLQLNAEIIRNMKFGQSIIEPLALNFIFLSLIH